ncbi:MAG: M6 family metalloprotease domain-containing protein [Nitrospiraceae bacterium]|nr:MAG: M6 family metalloprotease domain-containing protein [Nitrospiraceae bacterium]
MRGKLIVVILLLFSYAIWGQAEIAFAVHAAPDIFTIEQPDGAVLSARARGDEWNNSIETADGYTIHKDVDGFWYYVSHYDKNNPVVSNVRADKSPPALIKRGLRPARKHLRAPGWKGRAARVSAALSDEASPSGSASAESAATQTSPVSAEDRKIVLILARFTDRDGTYAEESFAALIGSLTDYISSASYGHVTLSPASEAFGIANNGVIGWLNMGYAHPDTGGNIDDRNRKLTRDAMLAADPFIDYASFDSNGDGYVDSDELAVVVVVAGYERSYSASYVPAVWGHSWSLGWGSVKSPVVDGVKVGDEHDDRGGYAQFGEIHRGSESDQHQATVGIMAHEIGHLIFGLSDLYDTDGSSEGIGAFGIMGSGSWGKASSDAYSGQTPVLPCAWSRKYLGWIEVSQGSGIASINAAGSDSAAGQNTVYMLSTGLTHEYFLVENRQPVGYDRGLEQWLGGGFGGLAIWHIDENTISNKISTNFVNSSECYPGGPSCAAGHYGVALMQADGKWDLEKNINRGNRTDLWYLGNASIFDAESVPDSHLYDGTPGNVSVTDISAPDTTMTSVLTGAVPQYQLHTAVNPAGSGIIAPDCSAGCLYDIDTSVVLTATANNGYFFSNWMQCDLSSNNVCVETMDADDVVTANFELCHQPVRIAGILNYYTDLQSAYAAAEDGDIIQTRAVLFTDDLFANRNISVTLEGGYNCNYSSVTDKSVVSGTMTISNGNITIGDFIFGN